MTTTQNNCPLCGATKPLVHKEEYRVDNSTYSLYECSVCRGQMWFPLKNPGAAWYQHDERYAGRNADPILEPNIKHTGTISFFNTPGRVLDVGCGVGNFLAHAKQKGWECWGIDFDPDAITVARDVFGLEQLGVSDLATFTDAYTEKPFDLVTFFDVFEHIDDHAAFLERIKDILQPDGHIALSVPYRHGWRWLMPHDLPPRHLTKWDVDSLTYVLKKHGFTVVRSQRIPASLRFLIMKMRFYYGGWSSVGLVHRVEQSEPDSTRSQHRAWKVRVIHFLAKAKDTVLFGIPALILWCALLFTKKRYTDFYVIAQKNI